MLNRRYEVKAEEIDDPLISYLELFILVNNRIDLMHGRGIQLLADEHCISGNVVPVILMVGIPRKDAPNLVRDHVQRLFLDN